MRVSIVGLGNKRIMIEAMLAAMKGAEIASRPIEIKNTYDFDINNAMYDIPKDPPTYAPTKKIGKGKVKRW